MAQRQLFLCGTDTAVSVWHRHSCLCGIDTAVSVAQKQIVFVEHRDMCLSNIEICPKLSKIIKSGMNQVQVAPFELKLCEDVATPPRNPKKPKKIRKNALRGAPGRNLHWSILRGHPSSPLPPFGGFLRVFLDF